MEGMTKKRLLEIANQTHDSDDTNHVVLSLLDYLLSECKELNPWLPIDENTPRDRELWLYWKSTGNMECGFYNHMCGQGSYPTHYQELPETPL